MSVPTPPEDYDYTYPENYVPPPPFPSPVSSMTLHITKGTPPNEVTYTESIPYASFGENSIALTNQQLIDDFSNKPPGTKYSYHITTNFVPGSFPTGDVVTTPTITNQTVKAIPILDITPFSPYNPVTEDHYIFETIDSNSNGAVQFLSSDPGIISIEPGSGELIAAGPGTATVIITQNSTPEFEGTTRYEKILVASTPEGSLVVSVEELRLQLSNNVTISYTGNPGNIPAVVPLFFQENIRRTGTREWFAVVDNRHRQLISNYANGNSTPFTPPGQSTPVPFNNIVTTHVTNMAGLFQGATAFNSEISSWDTRHVWNMDDMFAGALAFNQPLNNWNVSQVGFMRRMFQGASAFNQPLNNWNTWTVRDMSGMFRGATEFNSLIESWDTQRVWNMSGMFNDARKFNQPIGNWNTSSVTNMSGMFAVAREFVQPIGNWDTSQVRDMSGMFASASLFDGPIGNWDTSQVTNMASMFQSAWEFDQPIGNWNTSRVINMDSMFRNALLFNQPLNNWNTSQVTNMSNMFLNAWKFDQPLDNWNTSQVINMSGMFQSALLFNQNINTNQNTAIWRVSQVTSFQNFRAVSALSTPNTPLRFVNAGQ